MNRESDTSLTAKAFDFAQEVVKQEITLAVGIFTLTLTFLKDVVPPDTDTALLKFAWGTYIVSVLFGLLTLMALAGVLSSPPAEGIYSSGVRIFAGIQALLFFVALALTMAFGLKVA
jgi:hypothetical protein